MANLLVQLVSILMRQVRELHSIADHQAQSESIAHSMLIFKKLCIDIGGVYFGGKVHTYVKKNKLWYSVWRKMSS